MNKNSKILVFSVIILIAIGAAALLANYFLLGTDNETSTGGKRAYIIGVSNIQLETTDDSVYAADDAINVKNFLQSYAGFNDNNTVMKLNENATKSGIENGLTSINDNTQKDVVVFYFGGHGEYIDSQYGYVIVPYDAPDNLITGSQLQKFMNNINANKIICIFDCCKSGGFISDLTTNNPNASKYTILTACNSTESAHGTPELKGIFTTFLVQGLKNKAVDTNRNGHISIKEAYKYAVIETVKLCDVNAISQHPQMYEGNPGQDVDLVKV